MQNYNMVMVYTGLRSTRLGTLRQDLAVTGTGTFHFKAQVKLLYALDNTNGHCVEAYVYITLKSGSGSMFRMGRMFNIFPSSGWVEIGGDFEVPSGKVLALATRGVFSFVFRCGQDYACASQR
jgi:hypothetical protein